MYLNIHGLRKIASNTSENDSGPKKKIKLYKI